MEAVTFQLRQAFGKEVGVLNVSALGGDAATCGRCCPVNAVVAVAARTVVGKSTVTANLAAGLARKACGSVGSTPTSTGPACP